MGHWFFKLYGNNLNLNLFTCLSSPAENDDYDKEGTLASTSGVKTRKMVMAHKEVFEEISKAGKIKQTIIAEVARKICRLYNITRYFAILFLEKIKKVLGKKSLKSVKDTVQAFLQCDDNSRIKPGKGQTKTKCGVKMQKRWLSHSLLVLHAKFTSEKPTVITVRFAK